MKKNFKYGFSLAEAMIMLTIVSIIMAVSVPLIAKKAQVDTRTLLGHSAYKDNGTAYTSTSGAFGDNNRFGIGIKKAVAKLHVRDSAAATDDAKVIFQADSTDARAFKIFGDGSTNVRACVPDYAKATNITANVNTTTPVDSDGYLLAIGRCVGISITEKDTTLPVIVNYCPPINNATFVGPIMIPVSDGTSYTDFATSPITTDATSGVTGVDNGIGFNSTINGTLHFIPCATTPVR